MRLKVLSLFAAIQILSFLAWTNLSHAEPIVVQPAEQPQIHSVSVAETDIALAENPSYSVHFSSRNTDKKTQFLNSIKQNQIITALQKLPGEHVESVENVILDYDPTVHRGLGGNHLIILRGVNMGSSEMVAVFIHELGHNVDYGYLEAENETKLSAFKDGKVPIYESDPSLDFYRISWLSEDKLKKAAVNTDFVSGYAMTDCFEDFAESYVYYVLHNKDFKKLASTSDALYAKYYFLKYQVFGGMEFDTGDGVIAEGQRPWDITVLSYNFSEFMS